MLILRSIHTQSVMSITTTTNMYKRHIPEVMKLNELEFFGWYSDNIKIEKLVIWFSREYQNIRSKEDYLNECIELFDYMPNRI